MTMIDRNHLGLALLVLATLPLAAAACTPGAPAGAAPLSKEEKIARGEYLVTVGACNDCHTPFKMGPNGPEPDASRRLSGHPAGLEMPPPPAPTGPWLVSVGATNTAWSGPWGVSFTANLTPDVETGLGSWTPQIFVDTIRNGRHMGRGRPLLPPMPFPFYAKMTDEDLTAIFAYLRTLPAIDNRVPPPIPPVAR
jgi:mono/diheme cytochrome c family protein